MATTIPIEYKIEELERIIKILANSQGFTTLDCKHSCHDVGNWSWQDGVPCMYCSGLGWILELSNAA